MTMNNVTAQKKREKEYLNFVHSFLLFLSKTFDSILNYESLPIEKRNQLEQNVMTSISLLWTLHVCIFSNRIPYLKTSLQKSLQLTFDDSQSIIILNLLKQLKNKIEHYPFLNESYKIKCEHTLEHILHHYHLSSSTIVESNLHAPLPWLSEDFSVCRPKSHYI